MTFENYIRDEFARKYTGTADGMPDAFDSWLSYIGPDGLIERADDYAKAEVALALEAARIANAND